LFWHFDRDAASRTFCTAGNNSPIKIAMIAITTNSSISVNADRRIPDALPRMTASSRQMISSPQSHGGN
jgi:hypothetical protein